MRIDPSGHSDSDYRDRMNRLRKAYGDKIWFQYRRAYHRGGYSKLPVFGDGGGEFIDSICWSNNTNVNGDGDDSYGKGRGLNSLANIGHPPPPGVPQEWINWLSENVNWIWRTGPSWLFRKGGSRILKFDHPHGSIEHWHVNSDMRFLPHKINAEPLLKRAADTVGTIQTTYYMTKEYSRAAVQTITQGIVSLASGEVSFFPPMPTKLLLPVQYPEVEGYE